MSDPKHPNVGDLVIDASAVSVLAASTTKSKSFSKLRASYAPAVASVVGLTADLRTRAGISSDLVAELQLESQRYADAVGFIGPVKRLLEIVTTSAKAHGDKVSSALSGCAAMAEKRAQHDPKGDELRAALKDLMEYTKAPAKKAVDTKRKTGVLKPKPVKHPKKPVTPAPTNGAGSGTTSPVVPPPTTSSVSTPPVAKAG